MATDEYSINDHVALRNHLRSGSGSLLLIQAIYLSTIAVWPLVDIGSFMVVTGSHLDSSLVKTVAALLIPISVGMALFLFIRTDHRPAMALAISLAIAFTTIDLYCVLSGTISKICLGDAAIEFCLLMNWIAIVFDSRRDLPRSLSANDELDRADIENDLTVYSETKR
jgi:hypothetical protein